jgi:hypothetical protein
MKKAPETKPQAAGLDIRRVSISLVEPWEKNPRNIRTVDFERLKRQILRLGVYKPLVCYEASGQFVVLGGNMRLRALKALGLNEVDISVVHPKTEAEKIEYALSDNDRAGFYEEDKLAELVFPHAQEINLGEFHVDLASSVDLGKFVERYTPDLTPSAASSEDHEETYHFDIVFETKELCSEFLALVKAVKTKFPDVTIGRALTEILDEALK